MWCPPCPTSPPPPPLRALGYTACCVQVLRERDQTSGEPTPKESPGFPPPRVPRTEGTSFPAPRLLLVTAAAATLIFVIANEKARQRTAREQRKQREGNKRRQKAMRVLDSEGMMKRATEELYRERTRRAVAAASAAAAVAAAANEDCRQQREQNDADKSREPRPGGHYATLGIRSTATEQEVRTICHPRFNGVLQGMPTSPKQVRRRCQLVPLSGSRNGGAP